MAAVIILRRDAIARGLRRYFTGEPCVRGHVAERNTSTSKCLVCHAERMSAYRLANPEKTREVANRHLEKHPNYYAKKYAKNRAEMRRASEAWRKSNLRRVAENMRAWRAANPERASMHLKTWRQKNPGKILAANRRRKLGQEKRTPAWADLVAVQQMYIKARALSRRVGIKFHVDHIYPLHGELVCGLHTRENLRICTAAENAAKKNRMPIVVDPSREAAAAGWQGWISLQ